MPRTLLMALVLIGGLAPWAQAQQGAPPPAPAPAQHAATGLGFPEQIGAARLTRSVDYEKLAGDARLGFSWHYTVPGVLSASIYVYTGGHSVPDGANSPLVKAQFDQALNDITVAAQQANRYRGLRPVGQAAPCRYGTLEFWCQTHTATTPNGVPVFTRLLVGGVRGHFVKLRMDWAQNSPAGDAEAQRFQQTLFGALVR